MKQILFFLAFSLIYSGFSQYSIQGKIMDAKTGEVLAFANISVDSHTGTVSDFDGYFTMLVPEKYKQFKVSYIGYKTQFVTIKSNQKKYVVKLQPSTESLGTVVINGKYVNPAIALMKRAIKHKSKNDYRKSIYKYAYTKYYKFLVSAYTDKIKNEFDTIYNKEDKIVRIDSSLYELKNDLKDKDMFIMETVSKINAVGGTEKAKVMAQRVAGLKNPMYELLALQLAGQSVYDDSYKFLFQKYLGPFSSVSLKQYDYEIDDTLQIQNRDVIVVDYKNTKKPLISGKIFLDKQSLAIAKMTLNSYKEYQLNSTQYFTYYPEKKVWFPNHSDLDIKKAEKKDGLSIGSAVSITSKNKRNDSLRHSNNKSQLDYMYALSQSKISDVQFGNIYNDKIKYDMEVAPLASKQSEEVWKKYRGLQHSARELNTYKFIDSISEKEGVEKGIYKYKRLLNGRFPVSKYADLDFLHLLDYNRYEGLRLQLGGVTSEQLSNRFSAEAYGAYGFKDKDFKYSGKLKYKLLHRTQTYISARYYKDVQKASEFSLFDNGQLFQIPIHVNDDKFVMEQGYSIGLSHLIYPKLKIEANFTHVDTDTKFDIPFHPGRIEFPVKDLTYIHTRMSFTPFSKYLLSAEGRKMVSDGYPKFYVSYEQSLPQWQNSNADYYRLDLQIDMKKAYLNHDFTEALIQVGYADNNAPLSKLYKPASNYYGSRNLLKSFNINKKFAFETMKDLEFVDNFLVTSFLQHTFTGIKLGKKHSIDLRLLSRAAWGLSYDNNTYNGIGSMNHVYIESGIEFKRLFSALGLGFYYRMGHYALPKPIDNLSIRLTINPVKVLGK